MIYLSLIIVECLENFTEVVILGFNIILCKEHVIEYGPVKGDI